MSDPLDRKFIRIRSETTAILVALDDLVSLAIGTNSVDVYYRNGERGVSSNGFSVKGKIDCGTLGEFLEDLPK